MRAIIEKIVAAEWEMFSATRNIGGQASCQQDRRSFEIMRSSQFENWDEATLELYYGDLERAKRRGENLPTLKYAYMMKSTDPEGYARIADALPPIGEEKKEIVERLVTMTVDWCEDFARRCPNVASRGRSIRSSSDSLFNTSVETYSRGEFSSYGVETLRSLLRRYEELAAQGVNLHEKVVEMEVAAQSGLSLEEAEALMSRR